MTTRIGRCGGLTTQGRVVALVIVAAVFALAGCAGAGPAAAPSAPSSAAPAPGANPETSAAPATSVAQEQRFRDDAHGFSLVPPPGWEAHPRDPAGLYLAVFLRPEPDMAANAPFRVNINVTAVPSSGDLATDVATGLEQASTALAGYQLVGDESVALADGRPARLLTSTFTQQGFDLHALQLMVVNRDRMYVVTGTAPSVSFREYEQEFRRSLLSFSLS